MILEILFFITTLILGGILSETLFKSKEWISFTSKTMVLTVIIQTFEAFTLNWLLQNWTYFILIGILLNLIFSIIYKNKLSNLKLEFDYKKLILFIIIFLGFYLLYNHGMDVEGTNVYSSYPVWGDALFHFSIANNFLEQSITEKNLEYPIYSGAKLAYPFMIDYNLYLYLKSNFNPYYFYLFFTILLTSILTFLIFEFTLLFSKDKLKNLIIIALVFLTSSIGIFFLWNGSFNFNYAIPSQNGIFGMTPMIITDFYPRRSATLVYSLFFMFLISIVTGNFDNLIKTRKKFLIGILIGLTSFFEVHFTLILLLFLVLKWIVKRNKDLLKTILISVIFFTPNVVWISSSGSISSISLQPGFFSTSAEGLFTTILVNLLPLLIPIIIGFIYFKKLNENARLFLLLGFSIFIIANFVQFHKWNWDNIKFIRYAQFALIPILLLKFNKRILILLLIIFSLSGIGTIVFYFDNQYEFSSQDRIDFANYIKDNIPSSEVILTQNEPDNPGVYLAGRKTLNGGEGWLWSHGIQYNKRNNDLKELVTTEEFNEIKRKYNVKYISTYKELNSVDLKLLIQKSIWRLYAIK